MSKEMIEVLTSDGTYGYVAKMAFPGYVKQGYVIGVKLDNSFTINDLRRIARSERGIVIEYEKGAKHIKVRPSKRRKKVREIPQETLKVRDMFKARSADVVELDGDRHVLRLTRTIGGGTKNSSN